MLKLILCCLAVGNVAYGATLYTVKSDVKAFAVNPKNINASMEPVGHTTMSLTFNFDMGTVGGSIDFGTEGRINIENVKLPADYKDEPFTIDGFYQVLGGGANPLPNHANAKIIALFVDANTVIGSYTAGKQQDMTGSFVLKLK